MDKLCPLCNGLYKISIGCPNCAEGLRDLGLLQDFYGPYSSYEDQKNYEDGYKGYTEEFCVHRLACDACGWEEYRPMKRFSEEMLTN